MRIISIILSLLLFDFCFSQNVRDNKSIPENIYPFNGFFLNLENLHKENNIKDWNNNFKNSSKYAQRFSAPLWFEGYPTEAYLKNKKYELIDSNIIISNFPPGTDIKAKNENLNKAKNGSAQNFLFSTSNSVVYIKSPLKSPVFSITVYNEKATKKKSNKSAQTVKKNYEIYRFPFLDFFACTDDDLVFTSYVKNYPYTYLLNLKTGSQATYDYNVNGIIRNEGENEVIGFIVINNDDQYIKVITGKNSWTAATSNNYFDEAEALLKDSILVMATYSKILTGANLAAYHFKTGEMLWRADVAQMNVEHSQYYNKVILSLYKNKIILEGIEAAGRYMQIFDIKNGESLFLSGINNLNK